ncbi:MAG: AraC family transcriptional regulator [Ruminococcaceae bacterium]|nr:AraC family transcriptional regulator [Oscillospiraceae bacterium]
MEKLVGPFYEFRSSDFYYYSERTDSGDMGDQHCHNFYELYYLEKGQREYLVERDIYSIIPGEFVLIKPHTVHRTLGGSFTRKLIHFGYDHLKPYLSNSVLTELISIFDSPIIIPDPSSAEIIQNYWKIIEYSHEKQDKESFALSLTALLSFLNSYKNRPIPIQNTSIIDKITNHIERNALKINTLEEISSEFHISKYYLCHLFQNEKNMSVYDFLTAIKIAHASYELATTDKKIKEIAFECGFQSEYYFSKRFKQIVKVSPKRYKDMIRNKEDLKIE